MELPKDPYILLSWVNTRLRDTSASLPDLCAELDVDERELTSRLEALGCRYDSGQNRFL